MDHKAVSGLRALTARARASVTGSFQGGLRSVTTLVVLLATAAVIAAGATGWRWWSETNSAAADTSRLRETVLASAIPAISAFNTLDFHDSKKGLDAWQNAATGKLLDDVKASRETSAKAIEGAKTSTSAKVLTAAVTDLDGPAGTATVMAVVEITTAVEGQQPTTKRNRYLANVTSTDGGWKLSGLQPVVIGV
ncbi:hypothetical protein AB0J40_12450 [Amycolatopsis sp. NPDC049691]|uniref:hypothetical protein n=1 Tax=Amycolatopsis sp. NPDC049691 TaxID=3155155 RepID=UPI0034276364